MTGHFWTVPVTHRTAIRRTCTDDQLVLDLIFEDNRLNVYANG
jgi:hypothetical protein